MKSAVRIEPASAEAGVAKKTYRPYDDRTQMARQIERYPLSFTRVPSQPLIERPHELLVTLLVGITVINIGAAALAATIADSIFGPTVGLLVEIVVLVFILTTFGEVLPMTLAVKYPERFLAIAGRPVSWLGVILAPARATLTGLTALMVRIVSRGRTEQSTLSEDELRTLVDVGASEGIVEREPGPAAAALGGVLGAGVIDEDLAHDIGGDGDKVGPVAVVGLLPAHQAAPVGTPSLRSGPRGSPDRSKLRSLALARFLLIRGHPESLR